MAFAPGKSQVEIKNEKAVNERLSAPIITPKKGTKKGATTTSAPKTTPPVTAAAPLPPRIPAVSPIAAEIGRGGPMAATVEKQYARATNAGATVNHGVVLTGLVDELRGRLEYANSTSSRPINKKTNEEDTAEDKGLALAHQHLNNASQSLRAHQNVDQDAHPRAAIAHLAQAGEHIVSAVNAIPKGKKDILKDEWAPHGEEWNPRGDPSNVSVADVPTTVNETVQHFHAQHAAKSGTRVPTPRAVTSATQVDARYGSQEDIAPLDVQRKISHEIDRKATSTFTALSDEAYQAERDAAAPKVNLNDHFGAGAQSGRG